MWSCVVLEAIAQDSAAQGTISTIEALKHKTGESDAGLYSNTWEQSSSKEGIKRFENFDLGVALFYSLKVGAGSQSEANVTQVPAALRNFSAELVQDKWLCCASDGDIGLGLRSYLDLRSWFINSGVPSCEVCNEVGLKAKCCQNDDCTVRVHQYCLQKKISQSGGRLACSGCGIQWESLKSEILEHVSEIPEPPQSGTSRSRKRKMVQEHTNEDEIASTSSQGTRPESRRITCCLGSQNESRTTHRMECAAMCVHY